MHGQIHGWTRLGKVSEQASDGLFDCFCRRSTTGSAAKTSHPKAAPQDTSPKQRTHASRDSSAEPRDSHQDSRTDRPSDTYTDRDTGRPSDRHKDRRSDDDRGGHRDREASQRDSRSRDARDGRTDRQQARAPTKRGVVNPNSKQAELLAFAASDMNAFSNDGSFMKKFAASQSANAGAAVQRSPVDNEELKLSGKCKEVTERFVIMQKRPHRVWCGVQCHPTVLAVELMLPVFVPS